MTVGRSDLIPRYFFFQGEKIKNEKESVESGTRALAFDHYRTFIATAGKLKTLLFIPSFFAFDTIKTSLEMSSKN